jgi:hypothetical protein
MRDVPATGVVVGVTINHQQWDPRYAPPFAIASVAIDADPRVRLVTNLVDLEPEAARVGMRVRARFEEREDVWIPLFVPCDEPDAELPEDETRRRTTGAGSAQAPGPPPRGSGAITGVGMSESAGA